MERDEELAVWGKNRQYMIENQDILRKAYGDNYICVVDKNVVDSDKDEFGLVKRMYGKFPDKFVFISTIEDAVNPIACAMESPEGVENID